jgi:hypothetical protein
MDKPEETESVRQIKFLIHGPNKWGNGETLKEAKDNFRGACGSLSEQHIIWMWTGPELPTSAYVDDFGSMNWVGTKERPVLHTDRRTKKMRHDKPMEIGQFAL